MAIPSGILTATTTFGKTFDVFGANASVRVTVQPSHRLLWVATGDYLANFEATSTADAGVVGQFLLPRDQPGFRDMAGNEIRGWYYTAFITETIAGQSTQYRKVFTVGEGQSLIDLDTLPVDAVVMPPGAAPIPAVTSVNGEAGDVTVDGASSQSVAAALEEDGPAKDTLEAKFAHLEGGVLVIGGVPVGGGGGGASLTEDPDNPGLYLLGGSGLTEDPSNPGLYLIGA